MNAEKQGTARLDTKGQLASLKFKVNFMKVTLNALAKRIRSERQAAKSNEDMVRVYELMRHYTSKSVELNGLVYSRNRFAALIEKETLAA